jgi:hypothetical protein
MSLLQMFGPWTTAPVSPANLAVSRCRCQSGSLRVHGCGLEVWEHARAGERVEVGSAVP